MLWKGLKPELKGTTKYVKDAAHLRQPIENSLGLRHLKNITFIRCNFERYYN